MVRDASLPRRGLLAGLAPPWVWLLWLSLQLPSLRTLVKHVPPPLQIFIPLYLVATLLVYAVVLRSVAAPGAPPRPLDRGWLLAGLLIFVLAANYFLYPLADALKYRMLGSDQDDALILLARRLFAGLSPYAERTYHGNPISTGPGLVLLLLPFLSGSLYFLITPLCLTVLALVVARLTGHWRPANLFVLLCLSSPVWWETMVVGSDMFVMGGLIFLCLTLIYFRLAPRPAPFVLCALLLGAAATFRVIFGYLIPLVGLLLAPRQPRLAWGLTFASLAVALGLHAVFYFWDPANYTPLHLWGKGHQLLPPVLKVLTAASGLGLVVWIRWRAADTYPAWLFCLWLALMIPLAAVSLGDLWTWRHFDLAAWEGANYLVVPLPLLVAYVVLRLPGALPPTAG